MTNILAVHSVGESLRAYLENAYPESLRATVPCEFRLISSGELTDAAELDGALTLYLYRMTVNEHFRNATRRVDPDRENTPLALDLHFLITAWARSAFNEQTMLTWAMRQLQQHPVLDRSSLTAEAEWSAGEQIQLLPAELTTGELLRVWDSLEPAYRLSASYVARVVRIDTDGRPAGRPTVASRFVLRPAVPVP